MSFYARYFARSFRDGLFSFDFAFGLIKDLLSVANMLSKLILDIPVWLGIFLPPSVAGLFVVVLSVTVIYRIAGRD